MFSTIKTIKYSPSLLGGPHKIRHQPGFGPWVVVSRPPPSTKMSRPTAFYPASCSLTVLHLALDRPWSKLYSVLIPLLKTFRCSPIAILARDDGVWFRRGVSPGSWHTRMKTPPPGWLPTASRKLGAEPQRWARGQLAEVHPGPRGLRCTGHQPSAGSTRST